MNSRQRRTYKRKSRINLGYFDIERMKIAMAGDNYTVPNGITVEETIEYICNYDGPSNEQIKLMSENDRNNLPTLKQLQEEWRKV